MVEVRTCNAGVRVRFLPGAPVQDVFLKINSCMKIRELFESKLPDIVYHGTASANLSNIMKHGLKPKLNKWLYSNPYQHSTGGPKLQPGEKQKDLADLSTTVSFERAKRYAEQGGSTGWGNVPAVVLAFKPLPSDMIEFDGYDQTEVIFKNVIAPERLEIVWPERLTTKKDVLLGKAAEKKAYGATKTAQVKQINQQLKAAGSGFRIKSSSASTPRIYVIFSSATPLTYVSKFSGDVLTDEGPWRLVNTDIDSGEFEQFLKRELARPFTTTEYQKMKDYIKAAFPNDVV